MLLKNKTIFQQGPKTLASTKLFYSVCPTSPDFHLMHDEGVPDSRGFLSSLFIPIESDLRRRDHEWRTARENLWDHC